jgi:hypothetical protein
MKMLLLTKFILVATMATCIAEFDLAQQSDIEIYGVELPTRVSALRKRFGKPDQIDVPKKHDLCPQGQWYRWSARGNGVMVSALGDDYSQSPNYKAPVRFIQCMALHKVETKSIYGFEFNKTTRSEVEKRFDGRTIKCEGNYQKQDVLKIAVGDSFTYFFFISDRLVGVAQSTFDMDAAG